MSGGRYEVRDCMGALVSTHRTQVAAARAAGELARELGLRDDGAYCSEDGWPAIVDRLGLERVDYEVQSPMRRRG